MAKRWTTYHDISKFANYFVDLVKDKETFELHKTSYSRIIKTDTKTTVFNEEGAQNNGSLRLINKVRRDAKKYIEKEKPEFSGDRVSYYELLSNIDPNEKICKIDISAAYWTYALLKGVITNNTHRYFEDTYFIPPKEEWDGLHEKSKRYWLMEFNIAEYVKENGIRIDPYNYYQFNKIVGKLKKQARLKALGSLATKKEVLFYKDGKREFDERELIIQETRPLYNEINRGVDQIMKDINTNILGCKYYYWDCMFAKKDSAMDIMRYLSSCGYCSTVEETTLDIVPAGADLRIQSTKDLIDYPVRKEKRFLLNHDDIRYDKKVAKVNPLYSVSYI